MGNKGFEAALVAVEDGEFNRGHPSSGVRPAERCQQKAGSSLRSE